MENKKIYSFLSLPILSITHTTPLLNLLSNNITFDSFKILIDTNLLSLPVIDNIVDKDNNNIKKFIGFLDIKDLMKLLVYSAETNVNLKNYIIDNNNSKSYNNHTLSPRNTSPLPSTRTS